MGMTAVVAAASSAAAVACWAPPGGARLRALFARQRAHSRHWLAAAMLAQTAAFILGAPLLAAGAVASAAVTRQVILRTRRRQQRAARRDATVEAVFALASELRAGRTPAQALEAAAAHIPALAEPLAAAARAVRDGSPASEPLRAVATLEGCEALVAVAAVWHVTEKVGGAVADVLDRLGDSLDADAADRRAFEAALAGPRASMVLLAGLPALGLAMGQSAGARPFQLLLHRPLGWALLVGAAGLELLGLAWSRRLVRSAMPR